MGRQDNIDPGYTTDLHIRLKSDERDILQKKANEYGTTLSQAARRIIFRRLDGKDAADDGLTEKEAHYRILQAVNASKNVFKKTAIDIGRFVTGYEKAVATKNSLGEPAVNSEQTLRTVSSLIKRMLEVQDSLNEVIRHINGGSEIHIAAKPALGTSVGDYMSGATPEVERKVQTAPAPQVRQLTGGDKKIPIEFRSNMFTESLDGILLSDCETFMDGQYEKIHLRVQVNLYRNRQTSSYELDAIDFASRYKNVIPHLKKDKYVVMSGDFDFSTRSYNGVPSTAKGTLEIKTLNIPQSSSMLAATFDGTLLDDCETFTDGQYEKIRLRIQVNLYRNKQMTSYEIDAVDFASRYKNVMPFLKKDRVVIVSGEFDFSTRSYNGVPSKADATLEIKTLNVPSTNGQQAS